MTIDIQQPEHKYRTYYDSFLEIWVAEEYKNEPPYWQYLGSSAALTKEDCIDRVRKIYKSPKQKDYEYFDL